MEKQLKLAYWDFDGTLANTPLPNPGKDIWSAFYNIPYPYEGWWGRIESMDPNVFTIKTRPDVHNLYNELNIDFSVRNYILTSRQPKFEPLIKDILQNNGIKVEQIFTAKGSITKGERILAHVKELLNDNIVTDVYFFDDRNKEIVTVEAVRDDLHVLGIKLHIIKIESDAQD